MSSFIEPPIISTDHSHLFALPGDNIDLTCRVTGEIFPDIRWYKDNELVRVNVLGEFTIEIDSIEGNSSSNQSQWLFTNKKSIGRRR